MSNLNNNWFFETNLANYPELQETLLSTQTTPFKIESQILSGDVGVGKTHNAILLARDYLNSLDYIHYTNLPLFIQFNDFVKMINDQRFGSEEQKTKAYYRLRDIRTSKFLVIDDFFLLFSSKFEKINVENELLNILSEIWADRKNRYLIVTTNYTDQEVRAELSDAICSRLFGLCRYLEVGGKDKRQEKLTT
jgi:DNA replication protein DnaC